MVKMVEKVLEIADEIKKIRNIAICAHIDHGKTTFSDNLLAGAGMMSEELAGKACVLDFHEDEMARGITIDTASVSMVHNVKGEDYLVNLMDTPGHVDFGGDVTRAMRAVDGAIVLCCAVEGIMPQTETVLRQALKERVRPVLFINKVDRLIKELKLTPEKMQERFVKIIMEVNKLILNIAEKEFGEKFQVNVNNGSVAFGSAFHNWAMSIPYMKETGCTFKEVIEAYEAGGEKYKELAKKAPLHKVVLDMVVNHLPNPQEAQEYRIPKLWTGDMESPVAKQLQSADSKGPMTFVVVKIVYDPQAGEISIGRLFSGTITKGLSCKVLNTNTSLRIQQVFIMNGAKREIVDRVPAGNIIGVAGLKAMPGDTISDQDIAPFHQIKHLFEPVITKSIEPKKPGDLPRLVEVLRIVQKEDPTVQIVINEETGEYLISGMGELHLEIIENRIKTEKGLDVVTSQPIVVYRETVTKRSPEIEGKSPNKHNKLYFYVEPLTDSIKAAIKEGKVPLGRVKKKDLLLRDALVEAGMDSKEATQVKDVYEGNILVDATRGIVHIGEIMEMVWDMFENVMKNGPLANDPCIGIKVVMTDCKLHEDAIHRGPAQMYPAIRDGIREAILNAGPVIYEPLQLLQIEAPEEYMGEVSKLVSNKRGQLLDMQQEGMQVIVKTKLPVAEMFGISSDLRSATGGRGAFFVQDQMFELLPFELQAKVIANIRQRKGLKVEEKKE